MSVSLDKRYSFVGLINGVVVHSDTSIDYEEVNELALCEHCVRGEWVHGTSNCPSRELITMVAQSGKGYVESMSIDSDGYIDKVAMLVKRVQYRP